ncbi:PAS domain S-box protein [Cryptosporangium aurantiacum]|uniref:PAS domain S-box-containing protein n=1 Tax=Cryptosporangium aurantiacum TaxID=134849 RepID=A0A1M7IH88_9ACTN|nr:PAS domain S-box protein [Cryptosporangium aurantiacum]SHM40080.1 PAS domain S-box-containing protein [Cryptosporangium aurantiacum]
MGDTAHGTESGGNEYREMVDAIPDFGLVRLDRDGLIRGWYGAISDITGYAADEVLGQSASILHPEGEAQDIRSELEAAASTGRFRTEGWRVRKGGERFWATVSLTPMAGGYLKIVRDLTERRTQELALRSVEEMINSITDYEVIRLDADGLVRSWNPGAERLRQFTAAEVIGKPVSTFYSEEEVRRGVPEREMAAAVREGRFESEGWRLRRDGSRFWANDVLSPIRNPEGDVVGYVKISRDQSERREAEQLVSRQRDEILELSTPVIQVWDDVLVLPVIGTLDSARAARLTENLLERIARDQAEVVILDVSGVPAVDTEVAQHLLKTVEAARLMGSISVLSGVRPETAQAIVHLGIELGTLRCRSSLKDALQLALRLVGAPLTSERPAVDA